MTTSNPPAEPSSDVVEPDRLAELLGLAAERDGEAFTQVYDASAARAFGLALAITRDPATAEDVTAQAFLDVWRCSAEFAHSGCTALSWIIAKVHRTAVEQARASEDESISDLITRCARSDTSADQARVRRTGPASEVLELAYFSGYTHSQIDRLLDLRPGSAMQMLRADLVLT